MFSIGITLAEMSLPYEVTASGMWLLPANQCANFWKRLKEHWLESAPEFLDLIKNLVAPAENRFTCEDALEHEFLADFDYEIEEQEPDF